MKRFAVLALTAGLFGPGAPLPAAEPVSPPLPTGIAPTVPQVPVPVLADGYPDSSAGPRARVFNRFGCGSDRTRGCDGDSPGVFGRVSGLFLHGKSGGDYEPYDPYTSFTRRPQWCTNCAPAARTPLPPLPGHAAGGTYVQTVGAGQFQAGVSGVGGGCAGGACAAGERGGHGAGYCWHKFLGWLCYRQTPVHIPCTPNPRMPPTYTYFPCHDRASCAGGSCGPNGCAAGGSVAGRSAMVGGGLSARGPTGASCLPCPQPGEVVMPGYRLATPESGLADVSPATGPIVTSSYRPTTVTPGVPRGTGPVTPAANPLARPFPPQ